MENEYTIYLKNGTIHHVFGRTMHFLENYIEIFGENIDRQWIGVRENINMIYINEHKEGKK